MSFLSFCRSGHVRAVKLRPERPKSSHQSINAQDQIRHVRGADQTGHFENMVCIGRFSKESGSVVKQYILYQITHSLSVFCAYPATGFVRNKLCNEMHALYSLSFASRLHISGMAGVRPARHTNIGSLFWKLQLRRVALWWTPLFSGMTHTPAL